MELRDYVRILRKGWALVLTFLVVGIVAGVGITLATKKVYKATTELYVWVSQGATASDLQSGNTYVQSQVQSFTAMATSQDVDAAVVSQLNLPLTPEQLANKISASAPLNKALIDLSVTDRDPAQAALIANELAEQFSAYVQQTVKIAKSDKPAVSLTQIHKADPPSSPVKPNKLLNIGLGTLLGLLAGVGIVILRDVLDNRVKGPEDFEELGVPVLGLIPYDKRTKNTPIAFRADLHGSRSEAYRQLRTNLQFVNVDARPKTIAVTSAVPSEGKSTTSLNLAAALAEAGYRVCLVEADLRRPSLGKSLGVSTDVGFTTALINRAPVDAVLQSLGPNLMILTAGPIPPNPSELLITAQTKHIFGEIAEKFEYVIIDSAPLLPVTDGAEVAHLADATIVVHHVGKSTRDQALRSLLALEKVGEKPVGVVLNMVTRRRGAYDYQYGYYYTYRPERPPSHRHGDSEAETPASATTGPVQPLGRLDR